MVSIGISIRLTQKSRLGWQFMCRALPQAPCEYTLSSLTVLGVGEDYHPSFIGENQNSQERASCKQLRRQLQPGRAQLSKNKDTGHGIAYHYGSSFQYRTGNIWRNLKL